jgi:hypothetical protein
MLFGWLNRPVDLFGSLGDLVVCQLCQEQIQPTDSTTSVNQGKETNTGATKSINRITDRRTDRNNKQSQTTTSAKQSNWHS